MKRIFKTSVVILLYLILSGKSCVDENSKLLQQKMEVSAEKESIREEFEMAYLPEESQYASEISAIQKLKDLSDYLNIFSDINMDTTFRNKAGEMISEIFVSKEVSLSFGQYGKKKMKELALGQLLAHGFGINILSAEIVFNSIRVLDPIHKAEADTYKGILACIQNVKFVMASDTINLPAEAITVEMLATKGIKVFGPDTMNVWVVSLGEMEKVK